MFEYCKEPSDIRIWVNGKKTKNGIGSIQHFLKFSHFYSEIFPEEK